MVGERLQKTDLRCVCGKCSTLFTVHRVEEMVMSSKGGDAGWAINNLACPQCKGGQMEFYLVKAEENLPSSKNSKEL